MEKIIVKEVEKIVERPIIVERIVEKPIEVYKEKIVYVDRIVEKPVEVIKIKEVEKIGKIFEDPSKDSHQICMANESDRN